MSREDSGRHAAGLPPLAVTPLTPPRAGGIAVLVIWGVRAGSRMRRLFPRIEPDQPVYRRLAEDGEAVDEVIGILVPADRSPTGAEEGEITFHGGGAARAAMLSFLERRGAVTRTVADYLAGSARYDAVQREALELLPRARTERQAVFLLENVRGALSGRIASLERMKDTALAGELDRLLAGSTLGVHLARGARVLVVGPPNAGKSTLVNRLTSGNRSIVTDQPGTTRDILEAGASIEGIPVTYLDSAGIAESGTEVERLGTARVVQEIARADLVLCLGADPERLAVAPARALRLGPKADAGTRYPPGVLPVSGRTGLGIEALTAAVAEALTGPALGGRPVPFTDRQVELLAEAATCLRSEGRAACLALLGRLV